MRCLHQCVFASCLTLWRYTICTDRFPSLALLHIPLSLPLRLCSSAAPLSAFLLCQIFIFCSSFSCCDASLVFESCVFSFHEMLCCVTAAAWSFSFFLLLLLHPGSPTTLTYVSASDAIIYKCTMPMTMPNSSLILLLTPIRSAWMLLSVSLHPASCLRHHGRTSWVRSTVL